MENKKQSSFEIFIKPVLVLFVIAVVISGALAYVNDLTAPIIAENDRKVADAARAEVLPDADAFTQVELTEDMKKSTGATEMYKADNDAGYVITASTSGYGGALPVMVGLDKDGKIVRIKVMQNEETPGLGKKVEDTSYTDQFKNLAGGETGSVTTIAGATISSKAVIVAVDGAFEAYNAVVKGEAVEAAVATVDETNAVELKLIAGAKKYEKVPVDTKGIDTALKADGDKGYVFVAKAEGYGGEIPVAVALDKTGKIVKIKVLANEETKGLGTQVEDENFTKLFEGKKAGQEKSVKNISGATVSSEAVKTAVGIAFEGYKTVKGGA